jgi:hypothetical protein
MFVTRCEEYRSMASAYIDRQLEVVDEMRYQEHLDGCNGCNTHLIDTRKLSLIVRQASDPAVPRELHDYVMTAVRRQSNNEVGLLQRLNDAVQRLNPRIVSYAAGLVMSVVLFTGTIAGFRPISKVAQANGALPPLEAVTGNGLEYSIYNDLPLDPSPTDEQFYELPRVVVGSSLVSFSYIALQRPGDETAVVWIEIYPNGKARILEVLKSPSDPTLIGVLQWALSRQPLQPAREIASGQPVSTRIVLFVEKMDVIG